MGINILITNTSFNSLYSAWEDQSQWRIQLTLKVLTVIQTKRWHFTSSNLNTQVSQLQVILIPLSCHYPFLIVCINTSVISNGQLSSNMYNIISRSLLEQIL